MSERHILMLDFSQMYIMIKVKNHGAAPAVGTCVMAFAAQLREKTTANSALKLYANCLLDWRAGVRHVTDVTSTR